MNNVEDNIKIIEEYKKHVEVRSKNNIPPLPLNTEQTDAVCTLLSTGEGDSGWLKGQLLNRVSPGVDPSAEVKAQFLSDIIKGNVSVSEISGEEAVEILGTMLGGYNVKPLISALNIAEFCDKASTALSETTLVYDDFDTIKKMAPENEGAEKIIRSWAQGEWFLNRPELPDEISTIIRVGPLEGFESCGPVILEGHLGKYPLSDIDAVAEIFRAGQNQLRIRHVAWVEIQTTVVLLSLGKLGFNIVRLNLHPRQL